MINKGKNILTIKDVAEKAGVSVMTVSRVMNESTLVNEITRKKVKKIIDELNYKPNRIAKSLVNGKSKTIGIISSNLYNMAYTDIISTIEETAYANSYMAFNASVNEYETAVNVVNSFVENQVDGIIVLPLEMKMSYEQDYHVALEKTEKFIRYYEKLISSMNLPTVTISQKINGVANVELGFDELGEKSMNYLFERGYEDIALLNSSYVAGFWKEKEDYYVKAMESKGLGKNICISRDAPIVSGGFSAMNNLLKTKTPRAVYCANDYLAIGALQAIQKKGLRVPTDIAIIGNDDVCFCEMTAPKLTTISLNMRLAGEMAIKTLLKIIDGKSVEENVKVSTELIKRESI